VNEREFDRFTFDDVDITFPSLSFTHSLTSYHMKFHASHARPIAYLLKERQKDSQFQIIIIPDALNYVILHDRS
jgi:hypothetical protein